MALVAVDRSRTFADNLAIFVQHHLARHGNLAAVARTLEVEPTKLRRYASRKGSRRELRDIEFLYQLVVALNFDPITVFSAAQRAESLAMLLALAEGSIDHSLSPEFHGLIVAREDPSLRRQIIGHAAMRVRDADADFA